MTSGGQIPTCPACGQPVRHERQHQETDVQNGFGWFCPKATARASTTPGGAA